MYEYSLTSLVNKVRGRSRVVRMASSPLYEIVIKPKNSKDRRISDLTFYEAQHILHKERLLLAFEMLGIPPAKVAEYLKKLESEYHSRTGKFEDDLKWLASNVKLHLLKANRGKHVEIESNGTVRKRARG